MATYFLILTQHGSQTLAAAQAGTGTVQISHLVIGDANGQPYLPQSRPDATALVNERARVAVQSVAVVGDTVEVVATVDSTIGGFNLHEIGLTDANGQLLYLGNYHGGYKPELTEGAGGDLELVLVLATNGLGPVVVELDPTVVTANRQWVLDRFVRIPTFDAHVAQNDVEHANLLQLINTLNQRVANLEIREEIQIGEFIITDDPRHPFEYKGYGSWRLVPDVLLKGALVGAAAAQYQQATGGSDHQIRTTFFWQRFDPDQVNPIRTVLIDQDLTDVNLLDLFVATYGPPVEGEQVKFTVASEAFICASTINNYALITGDWPPHSNLSLDVLGTIAGRGGDGGRGGYVQDSNTAPQSGQNGGNAVLATYPITINNQGTIAGGGGGGGGGKASSSHIGGSGGGGAPYGLRGTSGWPYYEDAIANAAFPEMKPTNADRFSAGNGGISGSMMQNVVNSPYWDDELEQPIPNADRYAGWGGNGGGLGESGAQGRKGCHDGSCGLGQNGGLAGIALTGPIALTGNPALGR